MNVCIISEFLWMSHIRKNMHVVIEEITTKKPFCFIADYSKLLADSGIITVKGIKALIEATKKAAGSVSSKTSTE